jgi:hypothetical protein
MRGLGLALTLPAGGLYIEAGQADGSVVEESPRVALHFVGPASSSSATTVAVPVAAATFIRDPRMLRTPEGGLPDAYHG